VAHLRVATRIDEDFDPKHSVEDFTIASNDYLASLGNLAWQSCVHPNAPNLTSTWRPLDTQVADLLASGRVDFVLAPYAAQPSMPKSAVMQDMVIKPLLEDRFVLFADPKHELMRSKTVSLSEYAEAGHVLVSPQGSGDGIVDKKLKEQDLKRRVVHRTWSFGLAADFALMAGAVVVLPERFASLYSEGCTKPLPFEMDPLPSFIAWHSSRTSDHAHRWIRNQLRSVFMSQKTECG